MLQEIRVRFSPSADNRFRVQFTDVAGNALGVEGDFTPFLEEDDYENLRWYLEDYMDLPDGGAVILSEIAQARSDTRAAAAWAKQRNDLRAELKRRAGGGDGLPAQMQKALQQLALACAQAGFGQAQPQDLDPAVEENLAKLDQFPAPFPDFVAFLRHLAAGQLPPLPASLPAELRQFLEPLAQAIREAVG
ncbi:MAG: hypothetical protein NTY19_52015 [Planctomycetota bacterium]|nr:hypothetical protein [Planctomycetota bacterium]